MSTLIEDRWDDDYRVGFGPSWWREPVKCTVLCPAGHACAHRYGHERRHYCATCDLQF